MAVVTQSIHTAGGADFTTIQAWEDALDNSNQYIGECYGEAFSNVTFSGITYNSANYPHLTAHPGDEHDGRAHEVSVTVGNARIEFVGNNEVIDISDLFTRVSWLEIKGPGNNNQEGVGGTNSFDSGLITVRHCIIHNNHANNGASSFGIGDLGFTITPRYYRNFIYGFGDNGIHLQQGESGSRVHCNTVFENNFRANAGSGGIDSFSFFVFANNNAVFANPDKDIVTTNGVWDFNATSDDTGAPPTGEGGSGLINLTTANQFVNPTTTWANTDLLMKDLGAELLSSGFDLSALVGDLPELNVSIRNGASRATLTGGWDIGADQFEAAVTGFVRPLVFGSLADGRKGLTG